MKPNTTTYSTAQYTDVHSKNGTFDPKSVQVWYGVGHATWGTKGSRVFFLFQRIVPTDRPFSVCLFKTTVWSTALRL